MGSKNTQMVIHDLDACWGTTILGDPVTTIAKTAWMNMPNHAYTLIRWYHHPPSQLRVPYK